MKNSTIATLGIFILALLGISVFVFSKNSSQQNGISVKEDTIMMNEKSDSAMKPTKDNTVTGKEHASYIEYTKDIFDKAALTRRILFFYASWCPTCRPADASFTQNISKIPDDVTLIRVNYNDPETDQEEKNLAKKYGITYQHTFIQIDSMGNEVTKWNGGQIDELLSNIK